MILPEPSNKTETDSIPRSEEDTAYDEVALSFSDMDILCSFLLADLP
ncbi:MAG: hypothetical protein H6Q17_2085 [Bacteroidetes bacterium]|nr:hypothetical protein [Bacteroidota bacterium]